MRDFDLVEATELLNDMLEDLAACVSSRSEQDSAQVRRMIGELRVYYVSYLLNDSFSAKLLAIFEAVRNTNPRLTSLANVRIKLFSKNPVALLARAMKWQGIVYCLSSESRLISLIDFTSRDDVEAMIKIMQTAFIKTRDASADFDDSSVYQSLIKMGGSLINHLANVARPLPLMVTFNANITMPSLTLSQRFYNDASRWEELVLENKTIHPLFCQREMRGMSK